jgi:hypothetical protein
LALPRWDDVKVAGKKQGRLSACRLYMGDDIGPGLVPAGKLSIDTMLFEVIAENLGGG